MKSLEWTVADVVRKLREEQKPVPWTQERLADVADLSKATIVSVENNEPNVQRLTYEKIARAFNLNLGQLFSLVPSQETQRANATAGERFSDMPDSAGTPTDKRKSG